MLRQISSLLLFVAVALVVAPSAQGTILTFNIDDPTSSGVRSVDINTSFSDYGDNVNSLTQTSGGNTYNYEQGNAFTPDVTVAYSVGSDAVAVKYYRDDPDDAAAKWTDVTFLNGSNISTTERKFFFTFTPNPLNPLLGVRVNSFDLFRYTASQSMEASWTLYRDTIGGSVLDSGVTGTFDTTDEAPLVITTAGKVYQGTVILEIHHTLGPGGQFGMDNLNFDQLVLVPEPASVVLLFGGAIILGMRFRRPSVRRP